MSSPLARLLRSLDLVSLLPRLEAEGLDVEALAALTGEEWRELGLRLGDRKRIQGCLAERGLLLSDAGWSDGVSGSGVSDGATELGGAESRGGISGPETVLGHAGTPPASATLLAAGTALGPFLLHRKLGAGSFGEVWEAQDGQLDRRCALKIVDATPGRGVARSALSQEFSVITRVGDSDHVLRVERPRVERLGARDLLVLPMELADGGTLRDWMVAHPVPRKGSDDGPGRLNDALDLFVQACAGVQALHDVDAVHLDLKPENVLLVGGVPKVADFGLSRDLGRLSAVASQLLGDGVGTPAYMAPEQVRAARPEDVGPGADVWALGVILFELLDGKPPFAAASAAELRDKILDPSLRPNLRRIPERFRGLLERCLDVDETARPADARALVEGLMLATERFEAEPRPDGRQRAGVARAVGGANAGGRQGARVGLAAVVLGLLVLLITVTVVLVGQRPAATASAPPDDAPGEAAIADPPVNASSIDSASSPAFPGGEELPRGSTADELATHAERSLSAGRLPVALNSIDAALELAPGTARHGAMRARILTAMDRPAEALAQLDEAIQQEPYNPALYRQRASVHLALGDQTGADLNMEAVDRLVSGNVPRSPP